MYGASNFPNSQINPLFIQQSQNIPNNSNTGLMFPNSYPPIPNSQFNYPDNRNNQFKNNSMSNMQQPAPLINNNNNNNSNINNNNNNNNQFKKSNSDSSNVDNSSQNNSSLF